MSAPVHQPESAFDRRSLGMGLGSYVIWGFFPLYFHSLEPAGALEVIAHRAFWGFLSCLVVITVLSRWEQLRNLLRDREVIGRLTGAGFLILANWGIYVYAVQTDRTIDAALGYFINPLMTVALARIVLHERLNRAQIIAISLGILAVVVLLVGMGRVPWLSLALASTFAVYSLIKKRVAGRVPALEGMVVETAVVTPVALLYFGYLATTGRTSFHVIATGGVDTTWGPHLALLIGAGALTIVPLLLFARAAQGLPLAMLGLIQYIGPILQMSIGVLVFHEEVILARWIGTAIIWGALIVLSVDWIKQLVRTGRARA